MPRLRPYRIFISHCWDYSDDYYRLVSILDDTPYFDWENVSVPEHDPILNSRALEKELRNQIRPAHALLLIAGMEVPRRDWIDFEIRFARRIGTPIIGILPRGSVQLPKIVSRASSEIVGWNRDSIVTAIRARALRDD